MKLQEIMVYLPQKCSSYVVSHWKKWKGHVFQTEVFHVSPLLRRNPFLVSWRLQLLDISHLTLETAFWLLKDWKCLSLTLKQLEISYCFRKSYTLSLKFSMWGPDLALEEMRSSKHVIRMETYVMISLPTLTVGFHVSPRFG